MEYRELQHKTKAVMPEQDSKPSAYWIAILNLDRVPQGPKICEDYLWIKCSYKTKVEVIRQQFELQGNKDFQLEHNGAFPDGHKLMKDLDLYSDHLIVFVARNRPPLQPILYVPQQLGTSAEARDTKPLHLVPASGKHQQKRNENQAFSQSGVPAQSIRSSKSENVDPLVSTSITTHVSQQDRFPMHSLGATVQTGPPKVLPAHSRSDGSDIGTLIPFASGDMASLRRQNPPFFDYFLCTKKKHMALPDEQEWDKAWSSWLEKSPATRAEWHRVAVIPSHELSFPPEVRRLRDSAMPSPGLPEFQQTAPPLRPAASTPDNISAPHDAGDESKLEIHRSEVDFEEFFDQTPKTGDADENILEPLQSFQLQSLTADASLEVLEASVEKGVEFLNSLHERLINRAESSNDATQWIQQIDILKKQATKTRTIIGVVGNTGAGKSSVINAMLEEERLVPTNAMRACTAVVTELSYNYTPHKYRAEIEFISAADWRKDLTCLFQDLLDGNGDVSRDSRNEDSDAGIALAKIRAVYPKKTRDEIAKSSIERMMNDVAVSNILGTTKTIREDDNLRFYRQLQKYVDSKEKSTGDKEKDKKGTKEMEFWPLIKVVRLFVKSPALETGAVIVDLPGVHDANAARAAVAEGYMKQCSGLWIVAPIIRAVDDKAAKNLLGESFKRQLKMDGGFNSVTFICSKTDDISLTEASDSLNLDDINGPAWAEIDRWSEKQKSLKKELQELLDTKAVYGEVMSDTDDKLEIYEELREKLENGEAVYEPDLKTKKRKGPDEAADSKQRKKQKRSGNNDEWDDEEDDDSINDGDTESKLGDEEEDVNEDDKSTTEKIALTEEQIATKIKELQSIKKDARRQRSELDAKLTRIRKQILEAKQAEKKIEAEISKVCIEGRNAYSKGAIQQDFAAGMRELDQEIAAEDDEENFNPDAEIRDYDAVARSLPVFCVSSRGYQKLQGRLLKDPAVPGFTTVEETEIPQLQAHCKHLTVAGRTTNCKRFMTKLSQLLNSMRLWASSDGTGAHLTADQKAREDRFLRKSLQGLETGLEKLVQTATKELNEQLSNNIYDKYDTAIFAAVEESLITVARWGAKINRADRASGGLHWSTYKAICRRDGIYSNGQNFDWNAALIDPLLKHVSSGWETTFTRRCPMVMASLCRNASTLLKAFHKDIVIRARGVGAGIAGLEMLTQQLQVYEDIFKDLAATTRETINKLQKEINREFTPVVTKAMADAYIGCVNENGTGSYMRMKNVMTNHVGQVRNHMFVDSTAEVEDRLGQMILLVEEELANKADEVFVSMSRDYRSVLGGGDLPEGEIMPKSQRALRKSVLQLIDDAEKCFRKAAGMEVEEEDIKPKRADNNAVKAELDMTAQAENNDGLEVNVTVIKAEEQDIIMAEVSDEKNEATNREASNCVSDMDTAKLQDRTSSLGTDNAAEREDDTVEGTAINTTSLSKDSDDEDTKFSTLPQDPLSLDREAAGSPERDVAMTSDAEVESSLFSDGADEDEEEVEYEGEDEDGDMVDSEEEASAGEFEDE